MTKTHGIGWTVRDNDWPRVNQIFHQIAALKFAYDSTPTFAGLNITGNLVISGGLQLPSLTPAGVVTNDVSGNLGTSQHYLYTTDASTSAGLHMPTVTAQSGKFLGYNGTNLIWDTPAGTGVSSISVTAPITTTGGTTPTIGITGVDATHAGSVPLSGTPAARNFLRAAATSGAVAWDTLLASDIPALSYQPSSSNLTSLAALSYASTSFVKMTGANTFGLDTLPISVANGGTGLASWTANGILYASAATTLANGSNLTYASGNVQLLAGSVNILSDSSLTPQFLGYLNCIGSASYPTNSANSSGIDIDPYWTTTPSSDYTVAGVFRNSSSITTTGALAYGVYGSSTSVSDVTTKTFTVFGLSYAANHIANFDGGTGKSAFIMTTYGLQASSTLGYASKTISNKATCITYGGNITGNLNGTFNSSSSAGTLYGAYLATVDGGVAGSQNINSYACYIVACASKSMSGGGALTSWGLFQSSSVNNAVNGNTVFGGTTAPTNAVTIAAGSSVGIDKITDDLPFTLAANKTLTLSPTVYNDLVMPIFVRSTGANRPTLSTFTGNINQYTFSVGDIADFNSTEFLHDYKEGTAIEIHVHWVTNGLNNSTVRGVKWEIDYTWANTLAAGGTTVFAAATTVSAEDSIAANEPDKTHHLFDITSFTPTGSKIGGQLMLSLRRIASVTNVAPASNPWAIQIGVHYQIDTIGSRFSTTK